MEDWEKEVETVLRGAQQEREDRARQAQEEKKAKEENREKAITFIQGAPLRALKTLENGLHKQGLYAFAAIHESGTSISIKVEKHGDETTGLKRLMYILEAGYTGSEFTLQAIWKSENDSGDSLIQKDGKVLSNDEITEKDIIADFMDVFRNTFGK